ncbi:beta-1,3-galactosyl-O-glycosyl-glycoprotein beta-1,6-N-acetylglucosaminyltransferase 7 [Fukomys damarensis]|uniref:Beta-1,3-galactosyl-O-glycosyl-glycoprotein beta-1,6-N-acetylglucosaminyltransferase 7 n=1 Tax=Fukomys damarensis TaxID=885580 RepID=A0A091E873_FUKDA|nr:beta-1,3-galactosyl-O-glycosyl-glycoprotein beta-1,6-N-acetylglucosaminyltransferase 7 [Fukomys damarensis]KFO31346.1 Beta-1,3-galactosyl-O-glycosyl-glycoprotein beta-1,6-N-acetylglucosaminyltransferase 7 [Fukomys damarensis]
MSRLRATQPGLLVCTVTGVLIFLCVRTLTPEKPEEEPTHPVAVECGFYPDELCSALFEGKGVAPQIAKFCKIPHGSEILAYLHTPGNCSQTAQRLRFITRPLSAEEGNFPLAYIITPPKELAMFVQLLRAIYAPQNVYCIHVDDKAQRKYKAAVQSLVSCFENVFISSKRQKAASAGLTRLQTDINCMRDLVHSKFQWNYVINLCGEDFPIKTNKEIIHYIRSKWNDKNVTPGVMQPSTPKHKTSQSHPESSPTGGIYVPPNEGFKREPPHNLTIYFGSAYYVLRRKFVDFILTDVRAKDMLLWSRDIHSPERHYWVTLNRLRDAPGATPDAGWEGDVRAIKWRSEEGKGHDGCKGHYVQDTCVYGLGDLPWIIGSPSLFANKFEPSADPLVVTCLERRHRLKVLQQAEVSVDPHWRFQQQSHFNLKPSH